MAGTTPNLGLYLPGGGSTGVWTPDEVADIDPINQNFQKVDQFAGQVGVQANRNQQYYGPAAAISSVTGMKLGDEYQESDGSKYLWRYNGTNWALNQGGLFLLRPTSVSGQGTILPDGSVDLAQGGSGGATYVNGVFSAAYRNYRIVFNLDMTPALGLRLRMCPSDNVEDAATAYYNTGVYVTASAVAAFPNLNGITNWEITPAAGARKTGILELLCPNQNAATTLMGSGGGYGGSTGQDTFVSSFESNTVFTGFRLLASAAASWTSGNLRVYGYA